MIHSNIADCPSPNPIADERWKGWALLNQSITLHRGSSPRPTAAERQDGRIVFNQPITQADLVYNSTNIMYEKCRFKE